MNTTEYTSELEEKLNHLNQLRKLALDSKKRKAEIIEAAQESQDYIEASRIATEADAMVASIEAEIKNMALVLHSEGEELPGRVGVKMFTVVSVPDERKAFEWSLAHFTPALKLDSKVFEKAAKDGNIPAELAIVSKEPRAQIATNLDK